MSIDLGGLGLGMLTVIVKTFEANYQNMGAEAAAASALESALGLIPAALQAELQADWPTIQKWLARPTAPGSEGIFSTDDAEAKKGAELAASGDALPEN